MMRSNLNSHPPDVVNHLTIEEKVGQLLMVHFNGTIANEQAEQLINQTCIGNIILYNWAIGLTSPDSHSLQSAIDLITGI